MTEPQEHVEHGNMVRDERDEWPDGTVPGTFDITPGKVQGYPEATAHMLFVCPNGRRCCVLVGPQAVGKDGGRRLAIWQWDGNAERPTLAPSLNCVAPVGCGWHGFVQNGVMR